MKLDSNMSYDPLNITIEQSPDVLEARDKREKVTFSAVKVHFDWHFRSL
jgi:hypothetical protein